MGNRKAEEAILIPGRRNESHRSPQTQGDCVKRADHNIINILQRLDEKGKVLALLDALRRRVTGGPRRWIEAKTWSWDVLGG